MTLRRSTITENSALGGAAGAGGTTGLGIGGGIYNLGIVDWDLATLIFANDADLFDDCFGC